MRAKSNIAQETWPSVLAAGPPVLESPCGELKNCATPAASMAAAEAGLEGVASGDARQPPPRHRYAQTPRRDRDAHAGAVRDAAQSRRYADGPGRIDRCGSEG